MSYCWFVILYVSKYKMFVIEFIGKCIVVWVVCKCFICIDYMFVLV